MKRKTRRSFLAAAGMATLAGCTSTLGSNDDDPKESPSSNQTETSPTASPTRSQTASPNGSQTDQTPTPTATGSPTPDGPMGVQFENFESLDRWYRLEQRGSLSGETGDAYAGSQSMRIKSDGNDVVGAYTAFSEPKDFSGKNVSLALKVNSPANMKVRVELLAPDRGNKLVMTRTHLGPKNTWMRLDLGATREVRNPDLSSVQEIRIAGQKNGGVEQPVDILVDDMRLVERPDTGYVMLTFDDVWRSHYETAFPMMQEFGFTGVEGVVAENVYGRNQLDVGMMREMRDAGWDMASKPATKEFLPQLSKSKQKRAFERNKQFLERKGFRKGARHFVTPSRRRGQGTMELVREMHDTMIAYGGMPNALPSTTQYNYSRINAGNTRPVRNLIDLSAKYKQLLVCGVEDIGTGRTGAIEKSDFKTLLKYINRTDVEVVTASDLLEMQG